MPVAFRKGANSCKLVLQRCCDGPAGGGSKSPRFEPSIMWLWRGVRVVEGAALEKQCAGNGTEGSNPSLSAKENDPICLEQ